MTPINIQLSSPSGSGDWLIPLLLVWSVIWLFVLANVLFRRDFDPMTRLTWVIVVTFVPFFGVILYWIRPETPRKSIDPSNQLSGTPWEDDPGYTERRQDLRQRRSDV
jgi:hypothetical protein